MLERVIVSEFDGWPLHISALAEQAHALQFSDAEPAAPRCCGWRPTGCATPVWCRACWCTTASCSNWTTRSRSSTPWRSCATAGREVCGGLEIGVDDDQKLIGGARYRDKRPVAQRCGTTVMETSAGDRRDRRCRLMGKRSNFYPLVPRDFYPTPLKAVQPLIPHLDGIRQIRRTVLRRRGAGPASGIVRPALRLCGRHRHRPGRARAHSGRHRRRSDHHESAVLA